MGLLLYQHNNGNAPGQSPFTILVVVVLLLRLFIIGLGQFGQFIVQRLRVKRKQPKPDSKWAPELSEDRTPFA
ncbi:hypothetical protein AAVH_15088 [Aphelenchoides avenae]|nr:hypothetical protein AAVH_15088 [Aphelenchus avenae]